MSPRPHWKGYLKLSLVSCPIALYPALSPAERISFRQVNRETGHRLRQQLVDSVTGEIVQPHNKSRGFEIAENQYLVVQEQELEAVRQEARTRPFSAAQPRPAPPLEAERPPRPAAGPKLNVVKPGKDESAPSIVPPPPPPTPIENNRTIELDRFVAREQIDPRYYNTPYYIAPREQVGQEAFAVIRDAMAAKGLVGIGRVVLANRERPIMVEAMGSGLRGITLRFAHEIRSEQEYFADIPQITLPDEMIRITEHILETKTEDFDPAFLEDRYRTVLIEKLREKQSELPTRKVASVSSRQNVIDLMDALKRSLASERLPARRPVDKSAARRTSASSKSSPSKRSPARG